MCVLAKSLLMGVILRSFVVLRATKNLPVASVGRSFVARSEASSSDDGALSLRQAAAERRFQTQHDERCPDCARQAHSPDSNNDSQFKTTCIWSLRSSSIGTFTRKRWPSALTA